MRKSFLLAFTFVVFIGAVYMMQEPKEEVIAPVVVDARACYEYNQTATDDAPYMVNEVIDITRSGDSVIGTKTGTQSGPDMTNGYTGSLEGEIDGTALTALFSYVIEGSAQEEVELYTVDEHALIKHRYALKEEEGILVPDTESTPKDLIYIKTACVTEEIIN